MVEDYVQDDEFKEGVYSRTGDISTFKTFAVYFEDITPLFAQQKQFKDEIMSLRKKIRNEK